MPANPRRALKGKIVILYEQLFRGEDPSEGNPHFWDEFFLLRVNLVQLEKEFDKLGDNQILALKGKELKSWREGGMWTGVCR